MICQVSAEITGAGIAEFHTLALSPHSPPLSHHWTLLGRRGWWETSVKISVCMRMAEYAHQIKLLFFLFVWVFLYLFWKNLFHDSIFVYIAVEWVNETRMSIQPCKLFLQLKGLEGGGRLETDRQRDDNALPLQPDYFLWLTKRK